MSEEATIKLRRRSSHVGDLNKFGLYVDGEEIGTIGHDEEKLFNISPGNHSVYVKASLWSKTKNVDLDVSAGETKYLECGAAMKTSPVLVVTILLLGILAVFSIFYSVKYTGFIVLSLMGILLMIQTRYYLTDKEPIPGEEHRGWPKGT